MKKRDEHILEHASNDVDGARKTESVTWNARLNAVSWDVDDNYLCGRSLHSWISDFVPLLRRGY